MISALRVELRASCATDPGMSLLTAVEYITSDPAHRIALYRLCRSEDRSISGMGQDDPSFDNRLITWQASACLSAVQWPKVSGSGGGMKR